MADFMEMLDQSQRYSAQVMGLASQQIQAVAAQKVNEKQFAANHALQMTQLAEKSRMNDAALVDSAFTNRIRANEHAMNMELAPLKAQEASLRLQAAHANTKRAIEQQTLADVDAMFAPIDLEVGSIFAGNRNPEYAREYLKLKSEWGAKARQGQPFDEQAVRRQVEELNSRFPGSADPNEDYNPEVSFLLGKFDRNLQAREEQKSPEVAPFMPAVKASLLHVDERTFTEEINKHGSKLGPDGVLQASLARQATQQAEFDIKRYSDELSNINTQLGLLGGDPQDLAARSSLQEIKDGVVANLKDSFKERDRIKSEFISGKKIPQRVDPPAPTQAQLDAERIGPIINQEFDPFTTDIRLIKESADKQVKLNELTSKFTTKDSSSVSPLEGINLNDYYDPKSKNRLSDQPSRINTKRLKAQLYRNLEEIDGTDLKSLINPAIVDELLGSFKGKEITIDSREGPNKRFTFQGKGFFRDVITETKRGAPNARDHINYVIKSHKDFEKTLDRLNNRQDKSPYQKRLDFIDLYAAFVAASAESALQD